MGTLIIIALLGLVGILCFRTLLVKKPAIPESVQKTVPEIDVDGVANRLSQATRKATISNTDLSKIDWEPYQEFIDLLAVNYPKVHQHVEREVVNDYSLIYRFKGKNPELKPVLMIAHSDVVPVEKTTEGDWEHPAFDGVIVSQMGLSGAAEPWI